MPLIQFHVLCGGSVQGVGFRFTAQHLAQKYGMTGWVKNLSDGRVEILVQASAEQWDTLAKDLKSRFEIDDMIVQREEIQQKFKSFEIAY